MYTDLRRRPNRHPRPLHPTARLDHPRRGTLARLPRSRRRARPRRRHRDHGRGHRQPHLGRHARPR